MRPWSSRSCSVLNRIVARDGSVEGSCTAGHARRVYTFPHVVQLQMISAHEPEPASLTQVPLAASPEVPRVCRHAISCSFQCRWQAALDAAVETPSSFRIMGMLIAKAYSNFKCPVT